MKSETPPAGPDAAWRSRPRGLACRRVPTAYEWTPRTGTGTRALTEPPIPTAQARHAYGGGCGRVGRLLAAYAADVARREVRRHGAQPLGAEAQQVELPQRPPEEDLHAEQ